MSAISKMKSLVTQTPWSNFSSSSRLPQNIFSAAPKSTVLTDPQTQGSLRNPNPLRLKRTLSLRRASLFSVQSRGLQTESTASGEIHVIVGPMFAGKTTALLRRVQSERSNGRFQVKPLINNLQLDKTLRSLCISGRLKEAVSLLCRTGVQVNPKTYSLLLQECIFRMEYKQGRRIHAQIIVSGFVPNEYLKTKLLILCAKSGDLGTAHIILDKLAEKNLVSWNALISGYVQKGLEEIALSLYCKMRRGGFVPDQYTFASVFKAYANLATLELGKQAHGVMIKCNIKGNIVVNSALLDMYLKSSSLFDAHLVFNTSPDRNVITWTAMISGFGLHGQFLEVLDLFGRMKAEGFRPNYVTFLSVLSACSHGGFVDEAREYFTSMKIDYGIQPRKRHYAVMVDLLCRAGRVNEAYEFIQSAPCKEHSVMWGSLLEGCKFYGEIELAKIAAKKYLELEPENAGKYVVLSNAYAALGLWDSVAEVRLAMKELGMTKEPAYSRIDIQKEVHFFYKHDKSHKQSEEIYEMIKAITCIVKDVGYVPDLSGS